MTTMMELLRHETGNLRLMYWNMDVPVLLANLEAHCTGNGTLLPSQRDALAWAIQTKLREEADRASRAARGADEAGGHGEAVAPGWLPPGWLP